MKQGGAPTGKASRAHRPALNEQAACRCHSNLRIERDNAVLYGRLAELARDPRLARAYRRIAEGEAANAAFWEARLRDAELPVPPLRVGLRVRVLATLARLFGTEFVMPTVVRLEHADFAATPVDRVAHRDHFPLPTRTPVPHRHRAGSGNTLRAAVLGANDGLVSNASLVMGMAGAAAGEPTIVLAGLAGLVAGACSMALGEWLSVNTSREFYQAQITEHAERLAVAPEDGRRRIAGIYRERGFEDEEAEHLAEHLTESPRATLDALVREDLGIDPQELGGSAWGAAISSFCLFAFGALFPVAPYLAFSGKTAFAGSLVATGVGLAIIGTGTALVTGRGVLFSIARQFVITAAAIAVTFGIGHLLGVALTG
ncbi:VIT1/CCC1 transporter family protein [Dokdonella sp.]|uniref:VIT1/CCC1 transporter family protein n=1 Tax=Dokdonella sp. TaxID=2291710 RepID=UPI0031C70463|nr:VIT1/CCC1 transporter family protein [Dokdonella sp.]